MAELGSDENKKCFLANYNTLQAPPKIKNKTRALTPLFGNGAGAFRIGKNSVVLIKNWEKIQSFMH